MVACKYRILDQDSHWFFCLTALCCAFLLIVCSVVYFSCSFLAIVSGLSCVEEDFGT